VKGRPDVLEEIDYENANEIFLKKVECLAQAPSALQAAKNPQATVTKFDKREGGMFEQSYVAYHIHTPALAKTVERRYSDFEWLKDMLQWLHPGLPVPPIAKKGQFRRYDDKHLKKRMMILEMFVNKLLEIPQLRAEPVV
jgi:sorting nexin-7/30/sorting nexin-8